MQITGTHFNYYILCRRKLWLFANGLNMEHTSDLVYEGKLIQETTYPQRSEKFEEIEIGGCKIDYYDAKNKVIHEVKKSDKVELAHFWQVKYYIYVLEQAGIEGVSGIIEYPKLRKTDEVILSDRDRTEIIDIIERIYEIINSNECPDKTKLNICKRCSYYDFCYITEFDEK